jgi:uncharacterized protein
VAPTNILRADNTRPKAGAAKSGGPAPERREIVLRIGRVVLRARLKATPTADRIWQQLPIYGTAEVWGTGAVHFETHVETGRDPSARRNVKPGDIAYWVEDDRIIIGHGQTPISKVGEIRMPSPVNIWAEALDDVASLAAVRPGERVAILHADS